MKKVIIILIPLLVLVLVLLILVKLKFVSPKTLNVPESKTSVSELSFLNQPIFSFRGKIEKIDNQSLVINGKPVLDLQFLATGSAIQAIPKLTLKVLINSSTKISSSSANVSAPASAKLALTNLKINQIVIASSTTDLRALQEPEFTADFIILLPPPVASLQGKITDIKDSVLTITTNAIPAITIPDPKIVVPAQPPKTYQIIITKETIISTGDPKKPKNLTQKDLKNNQEVLIFTEDDSIITTKIEALRVELM